MMRLSRELTPDLFEALLSDYQRLLQKLFVEMGGGEVEVSGDSALAAFPAKQAALAAVAAQRRSPGMAARTEICDQRWAPLRAGRDRVGRAAAARCSELCDAAEGGQIFMSQETAKLLQDEDLGELSIRDLGEQQTRRTQRAVRAHELVVPP
jgi:class 3 adenylate cyclase